MIVDKLTNAHLYFDLSPDIEESLRYLMETDLTQQTAGKRQIEEGITLGISQYLTKNSEDGILEAHRTHIDVQYMIGGSEKMGYAFSGDSEPSTDYDSARDVQFFGKNAQYFILKEGMFSIFYPTDLHMPGLSVNEGGEAVLVKKAVIKVRIG